MTRFGAMQQMDWNRKFTNPALPALQVIVKGVDLG
jgi:hypothetical protein